MHVLSQHILFYQLVEAIMKHVIFFNTKGGVGKSTLCELSARELVRLGFSVSVDNTDQQVHVTLIDSEPSDYCLYDTAGAFTSANTELLKAASNEDVLIIIPMIPSKNDFLELPFLIEKLKEFNLSKMAKIVFTNTRQNSKSLSDRQSEISKLGLNVVKWSMPTLEDFRKQRDTYRTRNEISAFLHEILL